MTSYSLTWGALWATSTMCAAWCAARLVEMSGTAAHPQSRRQRQPRMALAGLALAVLGVIVASCAIGRSAVVQHDAFLWRGIVLVASVAGLLPVARRLGLDTWAVAAMLPTVGTAVLLGTWQQALTTVTPTLAGAR